jgi:hypothetical protein
VSLRDLYARYSDEVQFLVIYIREAHPQDGWATNSDLCPKIDDPRTIEERRKVAGECEVAMAHGIKTYVDEMDDPVMTAYVAQPERLYLVGVDGRVAYQGGQGPWGFEPGELEQAILALRADPTAG